MNKPRRRPLPPSLLEAVLPKILGSVFVLAAGGLALLYQCPSRAQLFIIYALVGTGLALLLVKNASDVTASYKAWNVTVALTGGIAVPFLLFWTDPLSRFMRDACDHVNITVFVHGRGGRQDMVLRQQGHVVLDLQEERKRASINENGEAYFQHMHIGDSVRLAIDFSEPYKPLHPDSLYAIPASGALYLPVALQGIDKVQGTVLYQDAPLAGVVARIGELADTSDAGGVFALTIPLSLQAKQYRVWLSKPGFKTKAATAFPQTGQAVDVIMEKP